MHCISHCVGVMARVIRKFGIKLANDSSHDSYTMSATAQHLKEKEGNIEEGEFGFL